MSRSFFLVYVCKDHSLRWRGYKFHFAIDAINIEQELKKRLVSGVKNRRRVVQEASKNIKNYVVLDFVVSIALPFLLPLSLYWFLLSAGYQQDVYPLSSTLLSLPADWSFDQ